MSALRSTRRCRHVLLHRPIYNGPRADRDAVRTLSTSMPCAFPPHPTPPTSQEMTQPRSTLRYFILSLLEISTTSGALIEITGHVRDQQRGWTHKGALFVSGARACARPSEHACTIHASHAARGTPTRARTRAHYCPFDRAFVRGRSLMLSSHLAGHYSASFWAQTIILAATATSCSSCARWCFQFLPGLAQCRTILRVAFR